MSMTKEEVIRIRNTGCGTEHPKVWNRQLSELCDVYLKSLEQPVPITASAMPGEPPPDKMEFFDAFKYEAAALIDQKILTRTDCEAIVSSFARISEQVSAHHISHLQSRLDEAEKESAQLRRVIDRGTPVSEYEKRAAVELDELRSRLAASERDAVRYRWLRSFAGRPDDFPADLSDPQTPEEMDVLIDTALSSAQGKGE